MKWQHLSPLPSPVNGTTLLEEAEITLIVDESAETKVVCLYLVTSVSRQIQVFVVLFQQRYYKITGYAS